DPPQALPHLVTAPRCAQLCFMLPTCRGSWPSLGPTRSLGLGTGLCTGASRFRPDLWGWLTSHLVLVHAVDVSFSLLLFVFHFFADKPRMNNILTSATEPYDLSFSRSFQNLSHLPPSYESAVKTNPSKYSSLKRLTDKEADEYYMRRRHLPDLAARGTLPINVIKMSQQTNHRERPRRPIRAMSQDRVLSPERIMPEEFSMSYERILSDEQLLSAERLHSQDPLLSPERSGYPEQSMSRALSHTDVFVSTPVLDRYRMTKMHSHPSASNNLYNTLGMNPTSAKRQAFASRRHNTVEQLHYIPGHHHHYRTASKTEVTV
uniref:Shisa family member 6 n=1 Tax=Anser cygnoides TaxID=8845 RepID=A0A8B9DVZ3_ANSCY